MGCVVYKYNVIYKGVWVCNIIYKVYLYRLGCVGFGNRNEEVELSVNRCLGLGCILVCAVGVFTGDTRLGERTDDTETKLPLLGQWLARTMIQLLGPVIGTVWEDLPIEDQSLVPYTERVVFVDQSIGPATKSQSIDPAARTNRRELWEDLPIKTSRWDWPERAIWVGSAW